MAIESWFFFVVGWEGLGGELEKREWKIISVGHLETMFIPWDALAPAWQRFTTSSNTEKFVALAGVFCAIVILVAVFGEEEQIIQYRRRQQLPPGKTMFVPTTEWQEVREDQVCPAGLEYRMELGGKNFARLAR